MTKTVLVLMGGHPSERAVSLKTGMFCAQFLREAGYDVQTLDTLMPFEELVVTLRKRCPDVVFNALHGALGEDGILQGLLDALCLPYTHSGRVSSALSMDKPKSLSLCARAGLPIPHGCMTTVGECLHKDPLPRPYILKPINLGSSVGVQLVKEHQAPSFPEGENPYKPLLAETFIPGVDLTVGVFHERALAVTYLPVIDGGIRDYECKYAFKAGDSVCPAPLPQEVYDACLSYALEVHRLLWCHGISRADFRYDASCPGTEGLYFIETNTQPSLMETSIFPAQLKTIGLTFTELLVWLVENARYDG